MKEALICFIIALVLGSIYNSMRQLDWWGTDQTQGSPARKVPAITETGFSSDVLKSSRPVLVNFYSDDSPQCKVMIPVIAAVAQRLQQTVKVVRMDAVESPQIAQQYGVKPLPDFVLFKDGKNLDHMVGEMSESALMDFVQRTLAKESKGSAGNTVPQTQEGEAESQPRQPVTAQPGA